MTYLTDKTYTYHVVESPDDGGYWISKWRTDDFSNRWVSEKIYPTADAAEKAVRTNKVKWER